MIKFQSLNKNTYFQQILKKENLNNNYFTIYFAKNFIEKNKKKNNLNVSFVVKKKIGNAVKRNKIKRRLRSIMNEAIKKINLNLDYSYLLIAKYSVLENQYDNIKKTIFIDLKKIK